MRTIGMFILAAFAPLGASAAPLEDYLPQGRTATSGYGDAGYEDSDFSNDTFGVSLAL